MKKITDCGFKMRNYSVVIRCFNEENYIGKLLSGLMEQTVRPDEIIIVDSGSTDSTIDIVKRYPTKIVQIKKSDFSFGRALNLGCAYVKSPFILISSGHVYPVYKHWAEKMLVAFDDERVGLVYGKQRGSQLTHYSEQRIFKQWFPEESIYDQKIPFCNNANAAIRKSLWDTFRYLEDLTGLEDLDFAKRIYQEGYKITYTAAAEVIHVHNERPEQIFNRYYREALAMRKIYPYQKFGKRAYFCLMISHIFSDIINAIWEGRGAEFWNIFRFRHMQFKGTYRGFNAIASDIEALRERFYYPRIQDSRNVKHREDDNQKINYEGL